MGISRYLIHDIDIIIECITATKFDGNDEKIACKVVKICTER